MNITMGAEIALSLHLDAEPTYAELETTLVDAGFTTYTILRTVNVDDTCDVQFYVRNAPGEGGAQDPLAAVETLQMLTEAIEALALIGEPTP